MWKGKHVCFPYHFTNPSDSLVFNLALFTVSSVAAEFECTDSVRLIDRITLLLFRDHCFLEAVFSSKFVTFASEKE